MNDELNSHQPRSLASRRLVHSKCGVTACAAMLATFLVLPSVRANGDEPVAAAAKSKTARAPEPAISVLDLRIVGPDDKPIPDAKVEIRSTPVVQAEQVHSGKFLSRSRFGASVQSDADGRIVLERPAHWDRLDIYIRMPGYAFYWAGWDPKTNSEPIPASLTAKVERAWTVGGIVVDGDGKPVPNALVSLQIEFTKRPGESRQWGVGDGRTTNNKGEWTFENVPMSVSSVPVTIRDPKFITVSQNLARTSFGVERGHSPTAQITLRPGLTVTGRVTDETRRPIAKALVRTNFVNDVRSAFTDETGVFRLESCEPGKARIVVSAKGRALQLRQVQISADMKPVDFEMKPGRTIRIRVLDERGNPAPKAWVRLSFDFEEVPLSANEHGVWEWNEAPSDALTARFGRLGGMQLSRQLVARDEDYVFKVPGPLIVSGKVIDAETRQPIKNFRVVPGIRESPIQMLWDTNSAFSATDGHYRFRETQEKSAFFAQIEADGYLSALSRDIKSDEGNVTIDFELSKAKDFAATVLTPEGVPAAGAKVAIGRAGSRIRISSGDLQRVGANLGRRETDEAGRFHFGVENGDFQVVITHGSGYAELIGTPSSSPKIIKLSPWARVEGTFQVARKPKPDGQILLNGVVRHRFGRGFAVIDVIDLQTSDAGGRFLFERVVPGRWQLGTFVRRFGDDHATEMTSGGTVKVNCLAGKTTHVEFGASGRPVIGQLRRPPDSKADVSWSDALVTVRADDPQLNESNPTFSATVDRHGSFAIDDVPQGNYVLNVQFLRRIECGMISRRFSVPAINEKLSQRPVDLGALTLSEDDRPIKNQFNRK
jgi:hypothetical protein